jgi:uncharacterized NAD(P)/FAD-binding protein YdhS
MNITFIGGGFSANAILYHFIRNNSVNDKNLIINIIEQRSEVGDGIAYNINSEHVLLNRPAKYMSIDYKQLNHFYEYLTKLDITPNEYETRQRFGQYLQQVLQDSITELKKIGVTVNIYRKKVINVRKIKQKYEVVLDDEYIFADVVVFSTGNNNQKNIWNLHSNKYINNLYNNFDKLSTFNKQDKILIIGASLSAIDCILFLDSRGHEGDIYCLSRSGVIPKVRINEPSIELKLFVDLIKNNTIPISLRHVLRAFRKQVISLDNQSTWKTFFTDVNKMDPIALHNQLIKDHDIIQRILTSSNPYIENIWTLLSENSKHEFIEKYYTMYMSNRNPMPDVSAKRILQLLEEHRLSVHKQEIASIKQQDNLFQVCFNDGSSQKIDWIINATGQEIDISNNELYINLLNSGLIAKNILGGISVCTKTQGCYDASGGQVKNLYAIGPITLGSYLNVNSAEMLSKKAECISLELIKLLEGSKE